MTILKDVDDFQMTTAPPSFSNQAAITEQTSFLRNNDRFSQEEKDKRPTILVLILFACLFIMLFFTSRSPRNETTSSNYLRNSWSADGNMVEKQSPYTVLSPMFLSLVLIPSEDSRSAIQDQINRLSKGRGPSFPAHVTIIGGVECQSESHAEQMAVALKGLKGFGKVPCSFSSTPQSFEGVWNQGLILTMDVTDLFLKLCEKSRGLLNLPRSCAFPPPVNLPHASLFYGVFDIPDETEVEPILPFEAYTVALWRTTPSTLEGVTDWKEIAAIDLL